MKAPKTAAQESMEGRQPAAADSPVPGKSSATQQNRSPSQAGRVSAVMFVFNSHLLASRPGAAQQQELVNPQQGEQQPLVAWEGRLGCSRIDDLWLEHGVVGAAPRDHAPARRPHVPVPGGVGAEGPRHHETVAQRPDPQRRGVGAPGAPAAVMQDADDRHPTAPRHHQCERVHEARDEPDQAASAARR
jgi:hypothetical protein